MKELYGRLVKEYKTAEVAVFRNVIAPLDGETVLGVVGRDLSAYWPPMPNYFGLK